MGTTDFLRRYRAIILLIVVAGLYYPRFIHRPDGMTVYPVLGECLLHGEPLESRVPGYVYPPAFALFMIPLGPLPLWLRNLIWYGALVGSTWLCFRLCERLVLKNWPGEWQRRELLWLRALTLGLILKFTLAVFENQSYDTLVFLCVLAGIYGLEQGKDVAAGAGLGLAAAVKVTPLLFLPYLVLRRRFKACLLCMVFYAGISVVPDLCFAPKGETGIYLKTWVKDIAGRDVIRAAGDQRTRTWDGINPLNQSLRTIVYRLTGGSNTSRRTQVVLGAVYLAYLVMLFGLLLKSARLDHQLVLDASLLLIGMLMLSPMSSKSHFVALMLPYMAMSAWIIREPRLRWFGGSILAVSFALGSLTSRDLIGSRLSNTLLSAGCITVGTLILLIFIAYIILKQGPDRKPAAVVVE